LKKHVIIVAGGLGKRMQTAIPKQFLLLSGKPVLMHTLSVFFETLPESTLALVLPEAQTDTWKKLCEKYKFDIPHELVVGGKERFHSVKNGLLTSKPDTLIGIHDGVRPLVSKQTILSCFNAAEKFGAAIPVLPLKESLREIHLKKSAPVNRNFYRTVQTPQCFQYDIIQKAYQQDFKVHFTDDASVVEEAGFDVTLIEGNEENIKITSATDLILAEALINH